MDEEIDRVMIAVRADTSGFAGDVAQMKGALEQGVSGGAERAGRSIEAALGRAIRTGKFGFDELRGVALRVLEDIAGAALKQGVASASGSSGLGGLASTLLSAVLGLPGRATGGPVSPGAAYVVGERGPELFVPTSSGAIAPAATPARAAAPVPGATVVRTAEAAPAAAYPARTAQPVAAAYAGPAVRTAMAAPAVREAREAREVKVSIAIHAPSGDGPRALARSGRQVARAVARALEQAGD